MNSIGQGILEFDKFHQEKIDRLRNQLAEEELNHELTYNYLVYDSAQECLEICNHIDEKFTSFLPNANNEKIDYIMKGVKNIVHTDKTKRYTPMVFGRTDILPGAKIMYSFQVLIDDGFTYIYDKKHCVYDKFKTEEITYNTIKFKTHKSGANFSNFSDFKNMEILDNETIRLERHRDIFNASSKTFYVDNYLNIFDKESMTYYLINLTPFPEISFKGCLKYSNNQSINKKSLTNGNLYLQDIVSAATIQSVLAEFEKYKDIDIDSNDGKSFEYFNLESDKNEKPLNCDCINKATGCYDTVHYDDDLESILSEDLESEYFESEDQRSEVILNTEDQRSEVILNTEDFKNKEDVEQFVKEIVLELIDEVKTGLEKHIEGLESAVNKLKFSTEKLQAENIAQDHEMCNMREDIQSVSDDVYENLEKIKKNETMIENNEKSIDEVKLEMDDSAVIYQYIDGKIKSLKKEIDQSNDGSFLKI